MMHDRSEKMEKIEIAPVAIELVEADLERVTAGKEDIVNVNGGHNRTGIPARPHPIRVR
jgi:hypothetical protein